MSRRRPSRIRGERLDLQKRGSFARSFELERDFFDLVFFFSSLVFIFGFDQPRDQRMNANIFFSSPELWLRVFNFLPFDSIKSLGQVNRVLNSVYRKVIHPTHIGIFPISIWSNRIFPLLSYHQLKAFQRVNQASRAITLSKPLSEIVFRSDVLSSKLKEVKVGMKLSRESYEEDDKGNMLRILYSGIHPFFGALSYSLGMDYEDVYIMTGTTFSSGEPEKTHNIALYKTPLDNATHPPVSSLVVELKDPKQHFVMLDSKRTVKVAGTGRPLFGGKDRAVTVEDVMKAFCKDGAKVKCEFEKRDISYLGPFTFFDFI